MEKERNSDDGVDFLGIWNRHFGTAVSDSVFAELPGMEPVRREADGLSGDHGFLCGLPWLRLLPHIGWYLLRWTFLWMDAPNGSDQSDSLFPGH